MTISINDSRNEYTATASQTVFSYTFRIFSATDLNVYVTPSGQDANDLNDITTSYTVSGVDDVAGGAITLSSGVNAGDLVTIVSDIPSSRTTDYQFNGDFTPETVNRDVDRVVALTKQVEDVSNRSLVSQQGQQGQKPLTLPNPVANSLMRWKSDVSGFENVTLAQLDSNLILTQDLIKVFGNVASMVADTGLAIGQKVRTLGYYSAGDGGGNDYEVIAAATGTADGGRYIDLNSLQAEGLFTSSKVDIAQFGAVGGGVTDDTAAIQAAFDGAGKVSIPKGTYKITSTLTITPPFTVVGAGAEETILSFEDMAGVTDGISIQQGGDRTISAITDMTMQVKGSNGKYCITSPRGTTVWGTNTPTYQFERLIFRGEIETATNGLYDYGWDRCLDIGDGRNHVFRDIEILGIYDFRVDPATVTTDSTVGFFFSGIAGEGGVLTPIIDHCYCHYVGVAVHLDYQVSNPFIVDSQFHRCHKGIYSPTVKSGTTYGVLEAQFSNLNINVQQAGISIKDSAFLDINAVRVTRADGGFDHALTWYGFNLEGVSGVKINGTRAYNAQVVSTYTNPHVGMRLFDCDLVYVSGYNAEENLTRGMILHDSTRVTCVGATFKAPSLSSIDFSYTSVQNPEVTIINDKHTTTTSTLYTFDGGINRESIEFLGGKTAYSSIDDNLTGISAAGGTTTVTVNNSNQVKYVQLNTSSSDHTFDVRNDKAREGDTFIFRVQLVSGFTGTVHITPHGGSDIWSKLGAGTVTQFIVEVIYTEAQWKLLGAYESDA